MPCPNLIEVVQLGQLFFCCSRSGASPSSRACLVLFPAFQLSHAAVCAATELSVRCSQDLFDLRTPSVLRPDRQGEPVVTQMQTTRTQTTRTWTHRTWTRNLTLSAQLGMRTQVASWALSKGMRVVKCILATILQWWSRMGPTETMEIMEALASTTVQRMRFQLTLGHLKLSFSVFPTLQQQSMFPGHQSQQSLRHKVRLQTL